MLTTDRCGAYNFFFSFLTSAYEVFYFHETNTDLKHTGFVVLYINIIDQK